MNVSHSIPSQVASISFSFLSSEDIRRISVKQIVNPVLLDDLNRPNIGGLYDPSLGPSGKQDMYVCSVPFNNASEVCADVQHVDSRISRVPVILAILNCLHLCSTRCSWTTCIIYSEGAVSSAIDSKLRGIGYAYSIWLKKAELSIIC